MPCQDTGGRGDATSDTSGCRCEQRLRHLAQ